MIRVRAVRVFRGPNVFAFTPIIHVTFDAPLARAAELPARLEAAGLPPLAGDDPSDAHAALEHVAYHLQSRVGLQPPEPRVRHAPETPPGVATYPHADERVGLLAGFVAIRLIAHATNAGPVDGAELFLPDDVSSTLDPDAPFDPDAELHEVRRLARRLALGPTTASLVQEAKRRGIPHLRLDDESLVQLGYGRFQQRVRASITSKTAFLATELAGNKHLTKALLDRVGLPVPRGSVVRNVNEAVQAAERLGYPVVTKPLDGNHGRGVTLALSSPDDVRQGFEAARKHSHRVIVEQQFQGHDHRVLVVNGEVVAVAERVPAHVVGDGHRTVSQLVNDVNEDPRRGEGHEHVMTRIDLDEHTDAVLARAGFTRDSVPQAGETVFLRGTANLSAGGTAKDRTDETHPDNLSVARRAASVIGLDVAGIDIVTPDITRSLHEVGGGIVEVNAAPGFRMHLAPSEGQARNVAAHVIDMLFPKGTPCRMPVIAITGTNGKTTTTRMVAHILKMAGKRVGFTTSTGIYVDDELLQSGDTTGPKSAKVILSEPTVDAAVLETARGGMLREGLAFETCDVGAVLNVQPDHLGLRGINTLEDLARVKSLVVELVTPGGTSVLNADDEHTLAMRERAGGRVVFFSMHGAADASPVVREHIAAGGSAVLLEGTVLGEEVVLYDGGQRLTVLRARDIPATLGGFARVNVQNALAACAVAHAQDVPLQVLRAALGSFTTSFEQSPGRLNLYEGHPFRVLLDYAHNPSGLEHLGELVRHMRPKQGRVIGVVGVAGDRRDEDILRMGAIAAGAFDEVIVREDAYRRGRPEGEGARLIEQGALRAGFRASRLRTLLHEPDAVEAALRLARQGDLVVILATEVEHVWEQIRSFHSEAVTGEPHR